MLIVPQTVLSILLRPSVAETGEGSGAGGYVDKFNMQSITVPTVAFAAAVVSFPYLVSVILITGQPPHPLAGPPRVNGRYKIHMGSQRQAVLLPQVLRRNHQGGQELGTG